MSFIDNLIEKAGYVSKQKAATPSVMASDGNDPFAIWKGNRKVDPQKAFDVYSGWVYACIRAIGEEIQKMNFQQFKIVDKDGNEEREYQSDLLDILEAPNESMTGMDMRFAIAAHLETVGNAYVFMDGVKDAKGKPTALYLLDASRVKVIVDTEVFPNKVLGYKYRTGTKDYSFLPYQIIHFKYTDPANIFEGIGTVQAAAQWIDADNYAMEFNRRFFLNGARIGGFLEAQQAYSTDQLEYIKKSFENAYKGVENAHKVLALPVGTKYNAGTDAQKDMDFSNLMTMMRDRILAAFRVPRTALGITDDVNRANAEATDYVFAARTIVPKMKIICSYINEFLTPRYGESIYIAFEDPVPENREQTMREITAALGSAPSMSVNEAREQFFGLEPIESGDDVMVPFSMTPLGAPSQKKSMNQQVTRGVKKNVTKTRTARNAEKRNELASLIAKSAVKEISLITKAVKKAKKKKNINTLSDDDFEPIYKAFFTRVSGYEKLMKEAIVKYNEKQQEEVLKNLEEATKDFDSEDLFDKEKSVQALIDLSMPIVTDLYSKEGQEAASLLGFTELDPLNKDTKKALEKSMKLMSNTYTDETLALLQEKLSKGIADGLGLKEMKDLVKDIYAFNDDVRAERVARTEVFRTANEASKEAWKQTGVVKSIKWYTAADERVCGWCEPMHGKIVDIEKNFFDKGDTVTGSDGQKMEVSYAPVEAGCLHPSCRCYTRPEEISLD